MNEPTTSPQLDGFSDPRTGPEFDLRLYPRVNGGEAPPPDASDRNDRIKLEFLAAYYGLNQEYARLLELRKQTDLEQRREEERRILQAIESLLIRRDRLEDQYAPFGVVAEPINQDGFTVDVKLSFGNVDAAGRLRSDLYTITACVPIPLPEGVRLEDLASKSEGPGIDPD